MAWNPFAVYTMSNRQNDTFAKTVCFAVCIMICSEIPPFEPPIRSRSSQLFLFRPHRGEPRQCSGITVCSKNVKTHLTVSRLARSYYSHTWCMSKYAYDNRVAFIRNISRRTPYVLRYFNYSALYKLYYNVQVRRIHGMIVDYAPSFARDGSLCVMIRYRLAQTVVKAHIHPRSTDNNTDNN